MLLSKEKKVEADRCTVTPLQLKESNNLPNFHLKTHFPILSFFFLRLLGSTTMSASSRFSLLLTFFLFCIILINHQVKCDEEDTLFEGINSYRKSLNLTTLTKNEHAECLAEELADQFKNQPCTNSTGSNTVPGTEQQFPNYESLLAKCHLNVSNTRDGQAMPACVPNLVPTSVLANFTESLYSGYLNDTKYTGAGIGSDGNWIVVVLTASTPEGSFTTYNAATLTTKMALVSQFIFLLGLFILVN